MNKKSTFILSAIFLLVVAGQFLIMNQKLLKTRRKLSKKIKNHFHVSKKAKSISDHRFFSLPQELQGIPFLDDNIIHEVKEVKIRNVFAPYNAALIEKEDNNYLLFFRYDVVRQMHFMEYDANIGCVELNAHFDQVQKEFVRINTQGSQSEDPRVIKNKGDLYLVYNEGSKFSTERKMHIAKLEDETYQPIAIRKIDPHLASTEKNWVPFVYLDNIYFEYQIFTPRKILLLEDPLRSTLAHIQEPLPPENREWKSKWGKPLGGSSAQLIDGQYLAFFHSKFKDSSGIYWYVMGAYTFEAEPPFRMTAMSKEPLLFKGIYQTEAINTADPRKYVIFPSGYVTKNYGTKTLIHLACGENDSVVKIITIDKEKLLSSLQHM